MIASSIAFTSIIALILYSALLLGADYQTRARARAR